ncbi:MAG: RsmE family RNA methyltransferase [Ginsengibacter sp.]
MSFPLFYIEEFKPGSSSLILNEDTSKHVTQVLRMQKGEKLQLTNGKGKIITTEIISENKKAAEVKVISTSDIAHQTSHITIAISLLKNSTRFEWFLEKATEIGVSAIIPIICKRTEKQHFRHQRMKAILISAMLQSQQAWSPSLSEPVKFKEVIAQSSQQQKYIAHCIDEDKKHLRNEVLLAGEHLILIGPEGDFTKDEVDEALQNNFIPVSLGSTRLRTETAGIVACVLLNAS